MSLHLSWFEVGMMRTLQLLVVAAIAAAPLQSQGNPADPDKKVAGGGTLPEGWSAALDNAKASLADVKFVTMAPGYHATTGPAVILYRAEDAVTGSFHTLATFHQTKAPTHAEAYGLIIAGKDLQGANRSYMYFIVRGDGKFMINTMAGSTRTVVVPWTENAALVRQDATAGTASNMLEIDGKIDPTKISFKANGKVVHEMPAAGVNLEGVVGLRINHNLDVHVSGFAVHKM
jgi:hypothetical protein